MNRQQRQIVSGLVAAGCAAACVLIAGIAMVADFLNWWFRSIQ